MYWTFFNWSCMNKAYWVGWNTETVKGTTSDKIWGFVLLDSSIVQLESTNRWWGLGATDSECYTFWAARGKAMQFKRAIDDYDNRKLRESKIKKGYVQQDPTKMEKIWPGFEAELEQLLSFAILTGRTRK